MNTPLRQLRLEEFLASLSAKTPSPGGGAVAGAVGAISASLARMVVAYSIGKKNLAQYDADLRRADATLANYAAMFLNLADEDVQAYAWVNQLQRLPETDEKRRQEWVAATGAAMAAPRASLAAAADMLRLIETLPPITNKHLHSDLAIAGELAQSAARSAWWNVRVNLALIEPAAARDSTSHECKVMLADAERRAERVNAACSASAG